MVDDSNDKKRKIILDLPLSDFPSIHTKNGDNNNDDDENDALILLQLPSITNGDAFQSSKIVITNKINSKHTSTCRWITSDQTSDLIRVESSNAYVLVPPSKQARLLRETDTYFLTTVTTNSNLFPTLDQVSQNLPNTMDKLVDEFAISPTQLQQLLKNLPYIAQQEDGILSMLNPKDIQKCNNAIVSTLVEECHSSTTLSVASLLPQIETRISDNTSNSIILYTLQQLSTNTNDDGTRPIPLLRSDVKNDHVDTIHFDMKKIARAVVMDLFQEQEKWKWSELSSKWQQRMPLLTEIEVSPEWLHGIAISSNEVEFQCINELHLPLDISSRIQQLFQKQSKYTQQQLLPYLQRFIDATSTNSIHDILSTYTSSHTDDDDDNSTTYYTKK